jgi:signal transduction histidine kinase
LTEFTAIILTESERISRLLENMLSLSSIHSGQLEIRHDVVDLGESVAATCAALRGIAREQDIEIELSTPADAVLASADRDRLAQVWTNLLSNAVKFSPAHSKIHVTIRGEGDRGIVEIQDHGPGIPEEDHALIFERFRQSTNNLTDKPSGTGLGLTIARDIIALHDGDIEVESQPHCGATFRVRIPLTRESESQAVATDAADDQLLASV